MPVYDYSYRVWEGRRRGALFRWLAIPRYAYMELFRMRLVSSILTLAVVMFAARLMFIYVRVNQDLLSLIGIPPQALPRIDARFFQEAIDWQFPLCFVLTIAMGANLISRDLKHNMVVLYASKPISRWEYFAGKFSVLFFVFVGMLCGLPLILLLMQALVAPEGTSWHDDFWTDYAWLAGAILIYGIPAAATLSILILAASSLSENGRYAGLAFAIFIIGMNIVAAMLTEMLDDTRWLALSPNYAVTSLGFIIFRRTNLNLGLPLSWGSILGYWVLAGSILYVRVTRRAQFGR